MDRRSFLSLGAFAWFPFHRPEVTVAQIDFRVMRYGRSNRRYVVIHGDEATAREILSIHMLTHPGIGFSVVNTTREVEINGGKFDPNRIFSRVGAIANLRKENPGWSDGQVNIAADLLDRERSKLVRLLEPPPGGLLIALHNNAHGYNMNEELDLSDQTSTKQPTRPHEFFLCTDPADFEKLAKSPFNVLLQNKKPTEDDGSLSRYAAEQEFRYVNLECTLGAIDAQLERLRWLDDNL